MRLLSPSCLFCSLTHDRSFIINEGVVAFGYAAGFKAAGQSSLMRLQNQLLALKQMGLFGSRLMASYLVFGKPMAIEAAHALGYDPYVHGTWLVARKGATVSLRSNEDWFRASINNVLLVHVGCTSSYFRHGYEARLPYSCPLILALILPSVQGIGRRIGDQLDDRSARNETIRRMFAMLSAHSPEMSISDYALDADAFRGMNPDEKSSWAAIGAAFNHEVFASVEDAFLHANCAASLGIFSFFCFML